MKTKSVFFGSLLLFLLLCNSCEPGQYDESPAGFLWGIWHGFIIFFSTLGKLFGFDVLISAEHNSGWPYWLGYLIGLSAALGGGSKAATRKKH